MNDYDLGGYIPSGHYTLLWNIVELIHATGQYGIALEFGVGSGQSTRIIANRMPVIGFDSFKGLPEDWRPGYPKGMFAADAPNVPNAMFMHGLFESTLPMLNWENFGSKVRLVHIDCDLYSSTKTVLDHIEPVILRDRPYIVFDEWHGYEGCEKYEQRAWREFAERTGVQWSVIGHSDQQWSIAIV